MIDGVWSLFPFPPACVSVILEKGQWIIDFLGGSDEDAMFGMICSDDAVPCCIVIVGLMCIMGIMWEVLDSLND
jgi:hypothetical protein